MSSLSPAHWIIVAVSVLLFGGRGRISGIMGDVADGIRALRKAWRRMRSDDASGKFADLAIAG